MPLTRRIRLAALLALPCLLAGCNTVVLNPSGYIADQNGRLVIISTILMLLIIVPVIILTLVFAWRYRASNTNAKYDPDWDHSTQLELVIWAAPLLIIIALGALTWINTHTLDPFRPLVKIDADRRVSEEVEHLEVQAVAMDWKWLFIYPAQGVATVNELVAPVDRPIRFKLTSTSVMNAFYVPALAGMIYAMPGMQTQLHAVINAPGTYDGMSSHYSGAGFSGMKFKFHGLSDADFDKWVAATRSKGAVLDRGQYLSLEKPSESVPVSYYAKVDQGLFDAIVNRCVEPGKLCTKHMMAIDEQGGLGRQSLAKDALMPLPGGGTGLAITAAAAEFCGPDEQLITRDKVLNSASAADWITAAPSVVEPRVFSRRIQ